MTKIISFAADLTVPVSRPAARVIFGLMTNPDMEAFLSYEDVIHAEAYADFMNYHRLVLAMDDEDVDALVVLLREHYSGDAKWSTYVEDFASLVASRRDERELAFA